MSTKLFLFSTRCINNRVLLINVPLWSNINRQGNRGNALISKLNDTKHIEYGSRNHANFGIWGRMDLWMKFFTNKLVKWPILDPNRVILCIRHENRLEPLGGSRDDEIKKKNTKQKLRNRKPAWNFTISGRYPESILTMFYTWPELLLSRAVFARCCTQNFALTFLVFIHYCLSMTVYLFRRQRSCETDAMLDHLCIKLYLNQCPISPVCAWPTCQLLSFEGVSQTPIRNVGLMESGCNLEAAVVARIRNTSCWQF